MQNEIIDYYNSYDEDTRLFRDHAHQVEWLTTMHYFDLLFPPCSRIFDGCAGTGNYAFALAKKGHLVTASDIVPHNVDIILEKQQNNHLLQDIFTGDICRVSQYENESFDIVLCMGAFYHLNDEMRHTAVRECLRLLKKDGILVISYINLIAALHLQISEELKNMEQILKWYDTGNTDDSFTYMMPEDLEQLARKYNLSVLRHLTSDGISYMHGSKLNDANEDNFKKYMELHMKTCENRNLLGFGIHGLIFLKKG